MTERREGWWKEWNFYLRKDSTGDYIVTYPGVGSVGRFSSKAEAVGWIEDMVRHFWDSCRETFADIVIEQANYSA